MTSNPLKFETSIHFRRHFRAGGNPASFNETGSPPACVRRKSYVRTDAGRRRQVVALVALGLGLGCASTHLFAQSGDPFVKAVRKVDYMEPARLYPQQEDASLAKLAELEKRTGRKPNILILLVDDMGWGDPGAFGGGAAIGAPTPNIDALARGGLKLTSTYAQPTCTPTRAALNTGRLPARTGLTRPTLTGEKVRVNPWAEEVTAASLLSAAGYMTALSGKWHLGETEGAKPHQVGFDEYLGILGVVSEYVQGVDVRRYPDVILKPDRLAALAKISEPAITAGTRGSPAHVVQKLDSLEKIAEIDQVFAAYSDDFIRRAARANKPFYLVHAFSRVHNDNHPAKGYAGRSPAAFPYKDAVVEVDDIVGRLVKTLKDVGEDRNTLVFFTSDNGANEDVWPDSGHQPWRGGKGTTWEGGVRVPGVAWWPGMIGGGRESDGLFDLMDLFNTSLSLAGIADKIPSARYIDGVDQASFLLADAGQSNREAVFMYSERSLMAIRWNEYKVHFRVFQTPVPGSNIDESFVAGTGLSPWVYNLYMDPKEQKSVGHRTFEWGLPRVAGIVGAHAATFQKYPMKELGLAKPVQ
jgi:arylsulfatase A-like enzyme